MIFCLKAEPYSVDVLVVIAETDARMMSHFRRYLKPDSALLKELSELNSEGTTWSGRTTHFDNGAILLRLKSEVVSPWPMALLAHEMYHAVCFILIRAGIPHRDETEEAYAYLLESLLTKAYRKIGDRHWK